jgi:hypothetical protein
LNDWSSTSTPSTEGYAVPISQRLSTTEETNIWPIMYDTQQKEKGIERTTATELILSSQLRNIESATASYLTEKADNIILTFSDFTALQPSFNISTAASKNTITLTSDNTSTTTTEVRGLPRYSNMRLKSQSATESTVQTNSSPGRMDNLALFADMLLLLLASLTILA